MTSPSRLSRETANLIAALRSHLSLLGEYSARAFRDGDASFLGEVAGKLRLLVYKSPSNRPLLLDLLDHFGFEINIPISDPGGDFTVTPGEYLDLLAFVIRTPSQGLVEVTNKRFVVSATWVGSRGLEVK
ncbi:MAG: hypothetical protein WBB65_14655 [Anaerolineales bacterium]